MTPGQNSELQNTTPKPEDETLKGQTPKVEEPSSVKKEPSPEEEPKTLTITEAEKLAQLARMDAGRAQKTAEDERDTAQTALAAKDIELTDIAEEREKLNTQIDELSSNDPVKFNIIKKDRDLLLRENKLKTDIRTAEAKLKTNEERIKKAEDHEREISTNEIAAKYEGGDAAKLVTLCKTFGANTVEEITKVADTMWSKKPPEPEDPNTTDTPPLKPFSGRTTGGGGWNREEHTPTENIEEGIRILEKNKRG